MRCVSSVNASTWRLTDSRHFALKACDAVRLDVGLAVEAELALDGQLDGQSVAVPAGLPVDVEALHGLEPREDVLEDAGLDVVGAGHAVRGGRALVERPRRAAGGLVEGLGEDVGTAPELQDLALHRGQVDLRRDRAVLVHRVHPSSSPTKGRGAPVGGHPAVPPFLRLRSASTRVSSLPGLVGAHALFFRRLRGDGPILAVRTTAPVYPEGPASGSDVPRRQPRRRPRRLGSSRETLGSSTFAENLGGSRENLGGSRENHLGSTRRTESLASRLESLASC